MIRLLVRSCLLLWHVSPCAATPAVGPKVNWQRRELEIQTRKPPHLQPHPLGIVQCSAAPQLLTTLPTMSYGKKDEDADMGLVKVDRTQVFQEGEFPAIRPAPAVRAMLIADAPSTQHDCSTALQSSPESAGSSSQRSPSCSTRGRSSPPTKPRRCSSAFRSSSRTRMPAYGRWCCSPSKSWPARPRI